MNRAFERLANRLIKERQLVKDGNLLRLASHEIQFSQEEETAKEKLEQLFLGSGMNTPTLSELQAHCCQNIHRKCLNLPFTRF